MNQLFVLALLSCLFAGSYAQNATATCAVGKARCGTVFLPSIVCCDAKTQLCCDDKCVPIDNANCGQCGTTCAADNGINSQACNVEQRNCVCSSTTNTLKCGDLCVDPNSVTTCGGCRTRCGPGQTCTAGKCTCTTTGLTACATGCFSTADLQTNEEHCGSCNVACASGFKCLGGICTPEACPSAGQHRCGLACFDLRSDINHCGSCFLACGTAGTECVNSRCVDATGKITDTVFSALGNSFIHTLSVDSQRVGKTYLIRSSRAHEFSTTQAIQTTVMAQNLPLAYEMHVYVSQSTSEDRAIIRETALNPARPAVLTTAQSSVIVQTFDAGKFTYLMNIRTRRTRDIEEELSTENAITFTVVITETVVNLPAIGRVNVNLLFSGMYKI